MYLAHIIIPLIIFYFYRNKIMLFGLLLGNLVDLDHLLLRIEGFVPWFQSICRTKDFWKCNGFFGYPLHTPYMIVGLIILSAILFALMKKDKDFKVTKWMFWVCIGALLHLSLDFIQLVTGFAF
jgi:hypothetical protein